MIYSNSYVTSPIVEQKKLGRAHHETATAEVDDVDEAPEWMKGKMIELAKRYASFSNKDSENAKNVMSTLNSLRKRYGSKCRSKRSYSKWQRASNCPRCNGYGMGQFRHVSGGICFLCGQMP